MVRQTRIARAVCAAAGLVVAFAPPAAAAAAAGAADRPAAAGTSMTSAAVSPPAARHSCWRYDQHYHRYCNDLWDEGDGGYYGAGFGYDGRHRHHGGHHH
jgi:hypothetical protein